MKKIKMEIIGLSYNPTQSGAYALVLGEEEGGRRLPIVIGAFEAQSIAIELENMRPQRPLTHDLFKDLADAFEIVAEEVIIYNLLEGIFYSRLICRQGDKRQEIDCRTSDAIALAVRFGCPIYTYDFIISQSGISMDENAATGEEFATKQIPTPKPSPKLSESELSKASTEELNNSLKRAIEEEDYEKASRIRDELKNRQHPSA